MDTREREAMLEMFCFVPTSTETVFPCSSRMMMGSDLDSVILGCVYVVWDVCVSVQYESEIPDIHSLT